MCTLLKGKIEEAIKFDIPDDQIITFNRWDEKLMCINHIDGIYISCNELNRLFVFIALHLPNQWYIHINIITFSELCLEWSKGPTLDVCVVDSIIWTFEITVQRWAWDPHQCLRKRVQIPRLRTSSSHFIFPHRSRSHANTMQGCTQTPGIRQHRKPQSRAFRCRHNASRDIAHVPFPFQRYTVLIGCESMRSISENYMQRHARLTNDNYNCHHPFLYCHIVNHLWSSKNLN